MTGIIAKAIRGGAEAYLAMSIEEQKANIMMDREEKLAQIKAGEPKPDFSLSPGQTRFDAEGNEIASAAPAANAVRTLNPDEASKMGLPEGGIYQMDAAGKILAPVKPQAEKPKSVTGMLIEGEDGQAVVNPAYMDATRQQEEIRAKYRKSDSSLTDAQLAANEEIDAAREAIAGMDREEIIARTQETQKTGRANADYDPMISALVKKALRRKVGEDPEFESLFQRLNTTTGGAPQGPVAVNPTTGAMVVFDIGANAWVPAE